MDKPISNNNRFYIFKKTHCAYDNTDIGKVASFTGAGFEIINSLIILSQTFFKVGTQPNKTKILVQEGIEKDEIFSKESTWEEAIKYSLGEQNKKYEEKAILSGKKTVKKKN